MTRHDGREHELRLPAEERGETDVTDILQQDRETLIRCRDWARELDRLREEGQRLSAAGALCSRPLDGMPSGRGGHTDSVLHLVARRDALGDRLRRAERESAQAEAQAREAIDRIEPTPGMYHFLVWYYVHGLGFKQAYIQAQISRRQGYRYRKQIEPA